jgi:hypothetical protein
VAGAGGAAAWAEKRSRRVAARKMRKELREGRKEKRGVRGRCGDGAMVGGDGEGSLAKDAWRLMGVSQLRGAALASGMGLVRGASRAVGGVEGGRWLREGRGWGAGRSAGARPA